MDIRAYHCDNGEAHWSQASLLYWFLCLVVALIPVINVMVCFDLPRHSNFLNNFKPLKIFEPKSVTNNSKTKDDL